MKYIVALLVLFGCTRPEAQEPKVGEATNQYCFSLQLQDTEDPLLVCTPNEKLCNYLHSKASQFSEELFLEGISDCTLADVQVTVK